jgi:2-keto-4-pentenoate hydratase/2-oxohepta-3-ene-1,7-dioic acid hydratase in catechol pathway
MKLATYTHGGRESYGAIVGSGVIDLGKRLGGDYPDLKALLGGGLQAAKDVVYKAQPDFAVNDIVWRPVVPNPDKLLCIGLNYKDHVAETGRTQTEKPMIFLRLPVSQCAHMEPIIRPKASTALDYEGELAVIIGKGGRHIAEKDAWDHVAGYSCYNDGSIRDWQRHTSQFIPGKNFPATGGFGPWMVTSDEIADPTQMELTTRLNGQVVQNAKVELLIFPIPELIAYCSTFVPLVPGDVIVSGTPGGVGFKRNPPLWMKPGDTVEVEISGIGILRNPIADEA